MAGSEDPSGDVFELDRIRAFVELMKEHDLNEVDLQQGDQRIRLRREEEIVMAPPTHLHEAPVAPPVAPPPTAAVPAPMPPPTPAAAEPPANTAEVTSPMVGTFFLAASPEAEVYVKVGDHVGKDTTVCIVEAMKVFNEIPAEVAGEIIAVLVENGDPVEFGQALFRVKTG